MWDVVSFPTPVVSKFLFIQVMNYKVTYLTEVRILQGTQFCLRSFSVWYVIRSWFLQQPRYGDGRRDNSAEWDQPIKVFLGISTRRSFLGSNCLTLISMLWVLSKYSMIALWVISDLETWRLTALDKLETNRWTKKQTNGESDSLSSCWSQKSRTI